jgi:hypothetical protein
MVFPNLYEGGGKADPLALAEATNSRRWEDNKPDPDLVSGMGEKYCDFIGV